jgi:hypothetical protein
LGYWYLIEPGLIKRKTNLPGCGGQPGRLAWVLSHHLVEKSRHCTENVEKQI